MAKIDLDEIIPASEARRRFSFLGSRATEHRLRTSGGLPYIKIGHSIFYQISALESFVASRRSDSQG